MFVPTQLDSSAIRLEAEPIGLGELLFDLLRYLFEFLENRCLRPRQADHHRSHFISTYFHAHIDDATHYDMIFNTDRVSVEEAAQLIAQLVHSPKFREPQATKLRELRHQVLG